MAARSVGGAKALDATQSTLLIMGCVCIVAAIVGGNLSLASAKFDALESPFLRWLLAVVGALFVIGVFALPDMLRSRPLKGIYLAKLDRACEKLDAQMKANWNGRPFNLESAKKDVILERDFLAEWRRWPTPDGDDHEIAEVQNHFNEHLDAYDIVMSVTTYTDAKEHMKMTIKAVQLKIDVAEGSRKYGSEKCARLVS
jgi:hypothetical protein